MATALPKALVDALETEGVEDIWAKLTRDNEPYREQEAFADGLPFHVDRVPAEKRRGGRRRGRGTRTAGQLTLFGGR